MRPEELLPTKRTLSSVSRVPPAVTSTCSRATPPACAVALAVAPALRGGGMPHPPARAGPSSSGRPPAGAPARAGAHARSPREARRPPSGSSTPPRLAQAPSRLARTAGCSYMWLFMAGASSNGGRGECRAREHVVGETLGELGDRVGRGRRDQVDVGVGHKRQVTDWIVLGRGLSGKAPRGVALELLHEHRRAAQGGEGGGRRSACRGRLHTRTACPAPLARRTNSSAL